MGCENLVVLLYSILKNRIFVSELNILASKVYSCQINKIKILIFFRSKNLLLAFRLPAWNHAILTLLVLTGKKMFYPPIFYRSSEPHAQSSWIFQYLIFYLLRSRKSKTWKFCFSKILFVRPILQMGVNKMSTFLYIKIFIVSVGLFVSYLILECLHMAFII